MHLNIQEKKRREGDSNSRRAKPHKLSKLVIFSIYFHLGSPSSLALILRFSLKSMLLFHPDPEKYVTGAYIKIGFFKTDDDLLYHDEIHGNLLEQVDKTLDLLLIKYMRVNISYEAMTRIEKYFFFRLVLCEALLNVIVHKDYSNGVFI